MSTPHDRATLYAAVDQRYSDAHPEAPRRIDPADIGDQPWIDVWNSVLHEVISEATDYWFFIEYPLAPERLDPNDSMHRGYIAEWIRIRDEILGDGGLNLSEEAAERYETIAANEPPPPDRSELEARAEDDARRDPELLMNEFNTASGEVREQLDNTLRSDGRQPDQAVVDFIEDQLDTARRMYMKHYFATDDHWISPRRSFEDGVGLRDLGIEVRVVGSDRHPRIGLVGGGTAGDWSFEGAARQ